MSKAQDIFGYRVLAKIGTGAASTIYAVQDPRTKQVWALKHVVKHSEKDQRFLEQVESEHAIGSKLDHVNIRATEKLIRHRKFFRVTDVGLVMELVDAQSLDQKPPRTQAQAARIFAQVAKGLAHMHSRRFVHADMKPSNVLVSEEGVVKIIDLGQACAIGTTKKRIQGTPGYMAPEQAHRESITPQTDIYNFGATMYWVLTREVIPTALPPKDDSGGLYTGAIDKEMVEAPVPPHVKNSLVHPQLSKLILDMVELEACDRPESMEIVAKRLDLLGDLLEAPAPTAPPIVSEEDTMF
jgi:eukaryotic-like serine/threonine-protein kinase